VDDGRGFIPPENLNQLTVHGHYGLIGMQERAEAINAALSIDSTPGAGTRIELDLPTGGARQTMG
jgi:signal transduction histidine kinase